MSETEDENLINDWVENQSKILKDRHDNHMSDLQKAEYYKFKGSTIIDEINNVYIKSKHAYKYQKLREKYLVSHLNNISIHKIHLLVNILSEKQNVEALTLLLSLFTGRDIEALSRDDLILDKENALYKVKVDLPVPDIPDNLKKHFETPHNTFYLKLPDLFKNFRKLKSKLSSTMAAKILKESIMKNHHIRFELKQLSYYMGYWMSHRGFDTSIFAIINGQGQNLASGVNYLLIESDEITRIYEEYTNHIINNDITWMQLSSSFMNNKIGSSLVLKNESITEIFRSLSETIQNINVIDFKSFSLQYNLYTIYTVFILNLSTGNRPVQNIYDDLKFMHLKSKLVYIEDKSRESTLAYRVAVMAEQSKIQLQYYLSFLNRIKNETIFSKSLNSEIDQIINGESPIFQLIVNNKLSEFKTNIRNVIGDNFNIQLNWNRHFMRTCLHNYDVDPKRIDMWMGHEGLGGYALSKFSSMSLHDLIEIANKISMILKDLKINPLKLV